jgi:hypothetical protein
MTERCYLAVLGDIRASRELNDRSGIQTRLESSLEELNRTLRPRDLAAGFSVTVGDEFQGLLTVPEAVVEALAVLEGEMSPVRFRYGLGWGPVATEIRPHAAEMDGPCFHRARQALELGKAADRWGTVRGLGDEGDDIATGILALLGAVREGWTDKQAHTVLLARRLPTQREVASALDVSPSTVSESLSSALYSRVCEAESALMSALRVFGAMAASGGDSSK